MALIALASAKGSPGVTTTALALTLHWPRPALLVEADLAGSSVLPGFFRGQVPHDRGLGPLAIAHSHGDLSGQFPEQTIQLIEDEPERRLLAGITGPQAAPAVADLWVALAAELAAREGDGLDAIIDLGRIGSVRDDREPLLRAADLVLLVTRSRLPDIAIAREVSRARSAGSDPAVREMSNLASLTVGPGRPYSAPDVAAALGLVGVGAIAWDPGTAEVLSDGTPARRRYDTSAFVRSIDPIVHELQRWIQTRRERFATAVEDR